MNKMFRVSLYIFILFLVGPPLLDAQTAIRNRISADIDARSSENLPGTVSPRASARYDVGRVSADTRIGGITMYFKPTAAQKADLDALVKAQQTPGDPNYHKWLSPADYARRFGLTDSDLVKVETWIQAQGFTIDRISNGHNSIRFTGTAEQVESTFLTQLHRYKVGSETHFANATQLSLPSALAGIVQSVRNLNDFRPTPYVRFHAQKSSTTKPDFTSSQSGDHYLTPADVGTIYDITAAYNAGYTGTGQSIAVVGQSEIDASDIEAFQTAAGLTTKDPTMVLVPGTGTAAVSSGDEAESDLDVEYAGSIAKDATIDFVYVGNNQNYGVFDSIEYAVDTKIAPIISASYGECEADLSSTDYATLESILEQGASQGQSIIVASGDDGSTACFADVTSNTVSASDEILAVNYPASSAYVTALGGTQFPAADVSSSNTTYWKSASGSDVVSSALSYIPEQAWNDDSATIGSEYGAEYALSSGGGGVSTLTTRPSWQAGVTGIASGSYRLVPDISLTSSPNNAGYLYCTSDSSGWSSGQAASCNSGFRDSSTQDLTVAGGTSFAAPVFAGMLAIINQKENSTGQGVASSALYTVASNATTYATAFHDVTSGSNECTAGSTYCSSAGESEYSATTGFDEATGLGSVDLYNLLSAWPTNSSASLEATTTSLAAASSTPTSGANDTITITVAPQSSSITTTPSGTLAVSVDGTTENASLALSNGSATYTFSSTTSGSHIVTATYSGDTTFAGSSGSVTVNVGGSSGTSSTGTFTMTATNVTVAQGSSGVSTITLKSENAYAGTVDFTLTTDSTSLQDYGCYDIGDTALASSGTATVSLTIYTSEAACSSLSSVKKSLRHFTTSGSPSSGNPKGQGMLRERLPMSGATVLAGFVLFGIRRRRTKVRSALSCFVLLGILAFSVGCGGGSSSSSSSSSSTSSDVAKGTSTVTLDGTDSSTASIAASTSFTVTVD